MLSAGGVVASWRCSCPRDAPFLSFKWMLTVFSFLVSSFGEMLIFNDSLRFSSGRAKPEDAQLNRLYSWSSLRGSTELEGIPCVSSAQGGFCCRAAWGWRGLGSSEELRTSICAVFHLCPCSCLLIQERDLGWKEDLQFFLRWLSFPVRIFL